MKQQAKLSNRSSYGAFIVLAYPVTKTRLFTELRTYSKQRPVCGTQHEGLLTGVAVHLWQQHKNKDTEPPSVTLTLGPEVNVYISQGGKAVYMTAKARATEQLLSSQLGIGGQGTAKQCPDSASDGTALCVQWEDGIRLHIATAKTTSESLECVTMSWNVSKTHPGVPQTPTDCYDMLHASWYGAFEDRYQFWPMNEMNINSSPYIVGEVFSRVEYGDVLEPLFVSSLGMGIHADVDSPLYLAINRKSSKNTLCLTGRIGDDTPYFSYDKPWLRYDLCRAKDISVLWKEMAKKYLPMPEGTPSEELVKAPIWSTWARYKSYINQSKALDFAREILQNNLSISQLEIDDDWTPHYGDLTFDKNKFPEPANMVNELLSKGIRTTMWMHPFVNKDADNYGILSKMGYFVKDYNDSSQPASVDWWRGNDSGIIDFTNPQAVNWYLQQMESLKTNYNVTSFKFDAGELTYLPKKKYILSRVLSSPNYFTKHYVDAACRADMSERRQEVRVGFRSQSCHAMVRMLDRASDWSHELGLLTLIPTALTYGLAGYPFVLPDMIGGNAYNASDIDQTVLPERELYIRWLQVTLLMPYLQFSVAPWDYIDYPDTTSIVQKMMKLREKYVDDILSLMKHAKETGEPMVRPLWWTDPLDKEALLCESQFLLGDNLLVAPMLEKGKIKRDIYLPQGQWQDELRGGTLSGKQWLRAYTAELEELPHFTRVTNEGIIG
ncbi:hypothetical protein RRG08_035770 [Elysia crispata]|uniref:Uncharacterized protein n=1 Tax=Elysia crispata TaxID=231223 RepID=A0AAE0ZLP2_9GAST|nr:hypothetical protein RRG08_035770 [Elysia crispata]